MNAIPKTTFGKILTIIILLLLVVLATLEILDKPGVVHFLQKLFGGGKDSQPNNTLVQPYQLELNVNRNDRIFVGGQHMTLTAQANQEGHLYLFEQLPTGKWYCVMPSSKKPTTTIAANQPVELPIPVEAPFGKVQLRAVVTAKPIEDLERPQFREQEAIFVSQEEMDKMMNHLQQRNTKDTPIPWTKQQLEVQTLDPDK